MDILWVLGLVAVWFIVNRWVLPKLGVRTWLSGACDLPVRKEEKDLPIEEKPDW